LAVGFVVGTCFAVPLLIYLLRVWFKYPPRKPNVAKPLPAWLAEQASAAGGTPAAEVAPPAESPERPPEEHL